MLYGAQNQFVNVRHGCIVVCQKMKEDSAGFGAQLGDDSMNNCKGRFSASGVR